MILSIQCKYYYKTVNLKSLSFGQRNIVLQNDSGLRLSISVFMIGKIVLKKDWHTDLKLTSCIKLQIIFALSNTSTAFFSLPTMLIQASQKSKPKLKRSLIEFVLVLNFRYMFILCNSEESLSRSSFNFKLASLQSPKWFLAN